MLKMKIKYFITVLLILPFLCLTILAQPEEVKQRRQIEHQAVRDFLYNKLLTAPVSTNPSNSGSLKY